MQEYNSSSRGIGLMSGTSLDGLDICYVKFNVSAKNVWSFKILSAETIPYDSQWIEELRFKEGLSAEKLLTLDKNLGFYFGKCINSFIKQKNLKREEIDFISSHGHTIYHRPEKGFTLQIGNGQAIALSTKIQTIYDFRTADVFNGGQGAPLVPVGDKLLFSEYEACLNLGGFCNISFQKGNQRIAYDISFCNLVLNRLAEKMGKAYDEDGKIASSAFFDQNLLKQLNDLDFHKISGPKSLGAEWLSNTVMPLLQDIDPPTALATCTEHIAVQIASVLEQNQLKSTLVTGGGAHNTFLLKRITDLSNSEIIKAENELIDYKESVIFALLGCLRINKKINVLSSVTGGKHDLCTGVVAHP